jgi:L-iditol 2-dehydrogenase
LLEPTVVALAGIERSGLRLGDTTFIAGAGPIVSLTFSWRYLVFNQVPSQGLVTLLAARAAGAEPIVISDLSESRLEFARKLVPGVRTILVERGLTPQVTSNHMRSSWSVVNPFSRLKPTKL